MDEYKISIIVPVYNSEKHLKKCLDSLVNQTYKNIEIITINDASTDDSLTILQEYENKYENFKTISLEKNQRQGAARNIGIKASTGYFISFVDSDDWIELDTYERVFSEIKDKNVDVICGCNYYREYSNGVTSLTNDSNYDFISKLKNRNLEISEKEQLLFKGPGVCQNIYKASLIKENNIYFPTGISYEDNYFVPLLFAYVNRLDCFEYPFYHYRENLNSTLFKNNSTQLDRITIEKMRYEEFKKRDLLNSLYNGYEILALKLYYLITLGSIYKFYNKDFIKLSTSLKTEFYNTFPDFKKNLYYRSEIPIIDKVKIISMEISPYFLLLLFKLRNK
ncbi:glycosyltransferase family 2 protein [[Clostridium] innocuum]|nr:glycosyltransferase family 2 protein [[Clostridium] innocuum]